MNLHDNVNLKTLDKVEVGTLVNLTVVNTGIQSISYFKFRSLANLYIAQNTLTGFSGNTNPMLQNLTILENNITDLGIYDNVLTNLVLNSTSLKSL